MYKNTVPLERLRELLTYDQSTGRLTWNLDRNGRVKAGDLAGGLDKHGYIDISIDRKKYGGHRVCWALHTGTWPKGDIDHINGVVGDNRIANMRDVPRAENLQNQRRAHRGSKTGILGVYKMANGMFCSRITKNYKRYELGEFSTSAEAAAAYLAAKRLLHQGCQI
jgi:hypothetical protein